MYSLNLPKLYLAVLQHRPAGWSEAHVKATLTPVNSLLYHAFVAPFYRIRLHQVSSLQRHLSLHRQYFRESYKQMSTELQKRDIGLESAMTSSTIDAGHYQRQQWTDYGTVPYKQGP